MFTDSAYGRRYVFAGLEAGPLVLGELLDALSEAEADFKPDPDRFTIRQALAHLADWEPIFLDRMRRMRTEQNPLLPGYDEGQLAIDRKYHERDWKTEFERFRQGRAAVLAFLAGISDEAWQRTGIRDEIGPVTIEYIAVLMSLHDAYHAKQFVEWRSAFAK